MIELRKILEKENHEYYSIFINIVENVKKIAPNVRFYFPSYTNHDYKHLENVEKNVNELINEKTLEILNEDEIFCLLCAVWLHDIGMIPFDNELEEYKKKSNIEKEEFVNEVRETHHVRSKVYVQNHNDILNLTDIQARVIGNICKGHRKTDLNEFKNIELNNPVRVSSLAAILRIADECDITKERESELSIEGLDESTKHDHYRIHTIVQKININHNFNSIEIISNVKEEEDIVILNERKNKISDELNTVQYFLKMINIRLFDVVLNLNYAPKLIQKKIILLISQEKDIYSLCNEENITEDDIDSELESLVTNKLVKDTESITEDVLKFKEIYKMFFPKFIKDFFYSNYVQNMISKTFIIIENKFNVNLKEDELLIRHRLIKNSPTTFYLLMFVDELIENTNFNIHSNQNGSLMFDSIILFGVFNDIHQFTDKINIVEIEKDIIKLNIFKEEYVLPGINFYKKLGM